MYTHKRFVILLVLIAIGLLLLMVSTRVQDDSLPLSEGAQTTDWLFSRNSDDKSAESSNRVLAIDSPGGLDSSMRGIIGAILDPAISVASQCYQFVEEGIFATMKLHSCDYSMDNRRPV